jgi:hypothetical protein
MHFLYIISVGYDHVNPLAFEKMDFCLFSEILIKNSHKLVSLFTIRKCRHIDRPKSSLSGLCVCASADGSWKRQGEYVVVIYLCTYSMCDCGDGV